MSNAAGELLYTISQIQDITARKSAEEALKASEVRFRTAFENAPIGMALVQPDRTVLRVNRALCSILGYSEEELLATTLRALTHVDDSTLTTELMQRTLAGELDQYRVEKRYVHRDGHVVWADLDTSLVRDSDGRRAISSLKSRTSPAARSQKPSARQRTSARARSWSELVTVSMRSIETGALPTSMKLLAICWSVSQRTSSAKTSGRNLPPRSRPSCTRLITKLCRTA